MPRTSIDPIRALNTLVEALLSEGRREIDDQITLWAEHWIKHHPLHSGKATSFTFIVQGGHMSTFTVDTTDGAATIQFTDDKGDATAGPNDSLTGAPVVPVITSDNSGVVSVGDAAPGANAGEWTAALTVVAEGTANIGVAPLANSDGTAVVDANGNPFPVPATVQVTVTAGAAAAMTLTVTG